MSNTVCIKTLNQGDAFNLDNSFLYIIYLFLIAHNSLQKCKKNFRASSLHQQTVHHTRGAAVSAWRVWPVLPCLPGSTSPPGGLLRNCSLNLCGWVQGTLLQDVWWRPFRGQYSGASFQIFQILCVTSVIIQWISLLIYHTVKLCRINKIQIFFKLHL